MGDLFIPHDFPPRERETRNADGTSRPLSEWGMLTRGKTLGKKSVVEYEAPAFGLGTRARAPVDVLTIQGDDEYAQSLNLTLSPPRFLPSSFSLPTAGTSAQDLSGTLDNSQITDADGPGIAMPFAIVEWGIGGVSNVVEADISNGLSLNLSASYLRVRCGVDPILATTSTRFYELSAFVGPGRPKDSNAQRTVFCGSLADTVEGSVIPIPRFAKRVYLMGASSVAGTVFVGNIRFQRDRAVPSLFPGGEVVFSANTFVPALIPNGALWFTVTNNSGALSQVYAIFELSV